MSNIVQAVGGGPGSLNVTNKPGQFISYDPNAIGYMTPVPEPKKDFEFCKDNEQVDWAKFSMWLRGFLSAIEGQPLTPDSIGKIMEKLAYVDPDRRLSYTEYPMESYKRQLQALQNLQNIQVPNHNRYLQPAGPQWVYNPNLSPSYQPIGTGTPADDNTSRWTTTGKQLLNDLKVYCSNALSNSTSQPDANSIRNSAASAV